MMRYSLANIKSYVTLGQELAYIESYLAIQKRRFGSRIDYNIYCVSFSIKSQSGKGTVITIKIQKE